MAMSKAAMAKLDSKLDKKLGDKPAAKKGKGNPFAKGKGAVSKKGS